MATSMLRVLPSLQFGHAILSGHSSPPSATLQTVALFEYEEVASEKTESPAVTSEAPSPPLQGSCAASDDFIEGGITRDDDEAEPQSPNASSVLPSRLRGIQMSPSDKELLLEGYLAQSVAALCLDDMPEEEGEGEGEDKGELPELSLRVQVRQSKALLTQSLLLTPAYGGSSVWAPLKATEEGAARGCSKGHQLEKAVTEQDKDGKQGNDTDTAAVSSPNSPHSTCSSSRSSSSASFAASSPSSEFFSLSSSASSSGSASPLSVLSPRRHHSEEAEAAYAAWNQQMAKEIEAAQSETEAQAQAEEEVEEEEVGKWDLTMLPDDLLETDDVLLVQQGVEEEGENHCEKDRAANVCTQEQQHGATSSSNPPLLPLPYPLPQTCPSSLNNCNGSSSSYVPCGPNVFRSPPIGLICQMSPQQQLWALQQHMLTVAAAAGLVPAAALMGMGMGMGGANMGMGMGMGMSPMGYASATMAPCMTAYQQPAMSSFQQQQPQQVCLPMEQQLQQQEEEVLPFKCPVAPGVRAYTSPQYLPVHAVASGTGVFLPRS